MPMFGPSLMLENNGILSDCLRHSACLSALLSSSQSPKRRAQDANDQTIQSIMQRSNRTEWIAENGCMGAWAGNGVKTKTKAKGCLISIITRVDESTSNGDEVASQALRSLSCRLRTYLVARMLGPFEARKWLSRRVYHLGPIDWGLCRKHGRTSTLFAL